MESICHLVFLSCLLFFSTASTAQKPWNLKWSDSHKPDNPGSIYDIVHADEQGYYALRCQRSGKQHAASLELYNKSLNFVRSAALEMEYKGEALDFDGFVSLKGKHFLLSSYYNAKQEKKHLFARPISMETLKVEGEFIKLMELDVSNKLRIPYFIPRLSPDSSLLMVYGSIWHQESKKEQFSMAVMGKDGKVLWSKDLELPYPEKGIKVKDYSVDNQGNVFVLVCRNLSNSEIKANEEIDIEYAVFAFLDGGTKIKEHKASLAHKNITDMLFRPMKNGKLLCAGFYNDIKEKKANGVVQDFKAWNSPNKQGERVKGIFSYKLNGTDGTEYDKNIQEFSVDILGSDRSANKQEKAKNKGADSDIALKDYEARRLAVRQDGSIIFVGEKLYYESAGKSQEIPHHDDLLVVNLSPTGQITTACKVDKEQFGGFNDSFFFFPTSGNQHFIYKEGFKKSANFNIATITADCKVTYAPFITGDIEMEGYTVAAQDGKTLIVWSDSKSKCSLGRLVFQ